MITGHSLNPPRSKETGHLEVCARVYMTVNVCDEQLLSEGQC